MLVAPDGDEPGPDAPMTVIGTGGVASLFEGATTAIDHFDPDLTIRGLLEIHRRNGSGAGGAET